MSKFNLFEGNEYSPITERGIWQTLHTKIATTRESNHCPYQSQNHNGKVSGGTNNNRTKMTIASDTYHNHREMVGERTEKTYIEHCVPLTHKNNDGGGHCRWQQQRQCTDNVKLRQHGRRCWIDAR